MVIKQNMTCPQTPKETQIWVPKQNNIKRRKLEHIPIHNTLGVGGCVGVLGWD